MPPTARSWMPRLLALLGGLALFPLAEVGLRLAGVQPGGTWEPPRLVQVVKGGTLQGAFTVKASPHFISEPLPDGRPGFRSSEAHRAGKGGGFPVGGAMRDIHVAATPEDGVERYVLLGGSAALGLRPMSPSSRSIPTENLPSGAAVVPLSLAISGQIEAMMAERGRRVEVVNAGMIAQDSSAVAVIAEEALALRPKGLLLYLGNNEGIGMAWAMRDLDLPEMVPAVRGALRHSRLYRVLAGSIVAARQQPEASQPAGRKAPPQGGQAEIGPEVLARIGRAQWESAGLPLIDGQRPTDTVHAAILARLERNLRQIVQRAAQDGVEVTIIPTPSHLGYRPFAEASDPGITEAARAEAAGLARASEQALDSRQPQVALEAAEAAVDLDSGSAGARYALGRARDATGDASGAVDAMISSVALDLSRKRTQPAFAALAAQVCAELGCRTTSAHADLSERARTEGLAVYDEILGDHEHLNPAGNRWIAGLFVDLLDAGG